MTSYSVLLPLYISILSEYYSNIIVYNVIVYILVLVSTSFVFYVFLLIINNNK